MKESGLQWDAEWQFHCLFNKLKAQLLHIHQVHFNWEPKAILLISNEGAIKFTAKNELMRYCKQVN